MGEERYVSVRTVAETHKLSLAKLIEVCERHWLAAREFGGEWYVSESAVPFCRALGQAAEIFDWRHPLVRPLTVLVLLISIIFATESLWQARAWQFLTAGARLTASAILQSFDTVVVAGPDQSATVFVEVERNLTRFWFAVFDFWQTLAANLDYGWQKIVAAWSGFLGRSPPAPPISVAPPPVIDQALIAQLKAEIKEELTRELLTAGAVPSQESPGTGLVVLPSSGNLAVDRAMAQELEQTFSDQVEVRFETSGRTGLITPIFRDGRGGDYLFVITPIKKQPPPKP
ncbi:MAG: hypothetical protein HY481_02330 [Candidatus Vogelbacteria bacterium]|nr:hypothetical protein [Candidatus Vogelbacteria bacterium]